MDDSTIKLFEVGAHLATILGVPIALLLIYREKRRERIDREYGTYNALDERYISFLELQAEYPELTVYDPPSGDHNWLKLDDDGKRRQQVLFQILISILERAYLMYRDQSNEIKRAEYQGWHDYMKVYARNSTFVYAWRNLKLGEQFHQDFVYEMESLIKQPEAYSDSEAEK